MWIGNVHEETLLTRCSICPVGGVSDPGSHRGDQTEDPGFPLIHHLPHAAGYTQGRGTQQSEANGEYVCFITYFDIYFVVLALKPSDTSTRVLALTSMSKMSKDEGHI